MLNKGNILHTFRPPEMFVTFKPESLEITKPTILKFFKDGHKRNLAIKVFIESLKLVIIDIIDNGVQFQFANSNRGSSFLCIQRITGQDYAVCRKRGAFKDFDPVDTGFSAYRIEYCVQTKENYYTIPVHINQSSTKKIAKLAKENKLKAGKIKVYQDYIEQLHQMFPLMSIKDITTILRFGYNTLRLHLSYGGDVLIHSHKFVFMTGKIYTDNKLMFNYVLTKLRTKIRVMYRKLHYLWDGYSYFTLTRQRFEEIKQDLFQHKTVDFGKVLLFKCYDEAIVTSNGRHALFKVRAGNPDTRFTSLESLVTDSAELLEIFDNWNWDLISPANRTYQTLFFDHRKPLKIYKQNYPKYIKWLRAKRWKELRK